MYFPSRKRGDLSYDPIITHTIQPERTEEVSQRRFPVVFITPALERWHLVSQDRNPLAIRAEAEAILLIGGLSRIENHAEELRRSCNRKLCSIRHEDAAQ